MKPWITAGADRRDEVLLSTFKVAVAETKGNVSRAALKLGISPRHAFRLIKRFELGEWAAALREAAGGIRARSGERKGVVAGRPRGT